MLLLVEVLVLLSICCHVNAEPTYQMNDLYRDLPFADVDAGVWKQGWDITYKDEIYDEEPLEVFVVMHSHTDPGWIKTFGQYFHGQTRHIFDNTLEVMTDNPLNHFIYAEMSFLSLWWDQASNQDKEKMIRAIERDQFEIVGGGWVMNDEATVHFAGAINQLMEGHEFLRKTLKTKPKAGWAIDPFGHSPTMAFLLKKAGFEHMLIQRTHYAIKKELAQNNFLEFKWRQQWEDDSSNSEIFTHMMPFFSYDIPHTCGPDPKICSLFDFQLIGKRKTFWQGVVRPLESDNIHQMATKYVDQVKKKAQLFRNKNKVLVILGEDFAYSERAATSNQVNNHNKLHKYINNDPTFKTKIHFSTLSEYFSAIKEETKVSYPSLQGDFFTYADRTQDYWSGYYVSRPYWKRKGRDLESILRAAEISHAWARATVNPQTRDEFDKQGFFKSLVATRRSSSVFQHHDGMTGTSKTFVMKDYGEMLNSGMKASAAVLESTLSLLLSPPLPGERNNKTPLHLTYTIEFGEPNSGLPTPRTVRVHETKPNILAVFNSLARDRTEVVNVFVNVATVSLTDVEGKSIPYQISPIVNFVEDGVVKIKSDSFMLSFKVELKALTVHTFVLKEASSIAPGSLPTKLLLVNPQGQEDLTFLGIDVEMLREAGTGSLKNKLFCATFDLSSGLFVSFEDRMLQETHTLQEQLLTYTSDKGGGAYLFHPKGEASSIVQSRNPMFVMSGPIVSSLTTDFGQVGSRRVNLYETENFLEVSYTVDMRSNSFDDKELVTRFSTDIKSGDYFYTDLQGLSMKQSLRRTDLPIQYNFYPMTTTAFIQDQETRFSIHTRQPFGAASLFEGQVEVMLDRRLTHDDGRGLGQAVMDNVVVETTFHLSFESFLVPKNPNLWRFPSGDSYSRSLNLNHPPFVLYDTVDENVVSEILPQSSFLSPSSSLAAEPDVHLVAMKVRDIDTTPNDTVFVFQRTMLDGKNEERVRKTVSLDLQTEITSSLYTASLKHTSLTMLHDYGTVKSKSVTLSPMTVETYVGYITSDFSITVEDGDIIEEPEEHEPENPEKPVTQPTRRPKKEPKKPKNTPETLEPERCFVVTRGMSGRLTRIFFLVALYSVVVGVGVWLVKKNRRSRNRTRKRKIVSTFICLLCFLVVAQYGLLFW
eukprot:TRINITY_DN6601_c0_g1_i1.p1 TRINITY_DN6601_c0_g1~~TRINITY_DN6601_c0_g1_i1.p1  ORF type:complete len:1153 (+),score=191.91 TRINITY_DN6601_c0_g1_i1:13-3471(+)